MKRLLHVLLVVSAILLLIYASYAWMRPFARSPRNVLLITVDLLKAPVVTSPEFAPFTPRMRGLAGEGLMCTDAVAHSDRTEWAAHCLLTSRFLSEYFSGSQPFGVQHASLADALKARGYVTGAFLSSAGFYGNMQVDGFDTYDVADFSEGGRGYRKGEVTNAHAMAWLKQRRESEPWFAWLMYWDLHDPVEMAPAAYREAVGAPAPCGDRDYNQTVLYEDYCVAQVLDFLAKSGMDSDTLVVLTGIHGGGSARHRVRGLYQGTVHVPLIMRAPGLIGPGTRIETPVMHVDVLPTIVQLLGLPEVACAGLSILEQDDPSRAVYAETYQLEARSVREGRWKYIETLENLDKPQWRQRTADLPPDPARPGFVIVVPKGTRELYDLSKDPFEQHNLVGQQIEISARLHRKLEQWQARNGGPRVIMSTPDPKLREFMQKNGYWSR